MSHGTGSGYAVVSPAELNRRAVDGARLRCAALRARLGTTSLTEPLNGSAAAWQRYECALIEAVDAAAMELVADAVRVRTDELALVLPAHPPAQRGDMSDLLARVVDASARARLTTIVRQAADADDPAAARGLLQVVRAEAQRELRAQDARVQLTARARRLADLYADVPAAAVLRATLEERAPTIEEDTLVRVEQQLVELRARAIAEADRRFVVEQTAAALRTLGYAVGEEFVPEALSGRAVVTAPEGPSYGLELDFHPQRPRLVTEVVAFTPSSAHDREAEEAACRNLERLSSELEGAVALTREQTLAPGAAPVVRLTAPATAPASLAQGRVRAR